MTDDERWLDEQTDAALDLIVGNYACWVTSYGPLKGEQFWKSVVCALIRKDFERQLELKKDRP